MIVQRIHRGPPYHQRQNPLRRCQSGARIVGRPYAALARRSFSSFLSSMSRFSLLR
jgi:hypothetical protein